MSAVLAEPIQSADLQLAEARIAYRAMQRAESTMHRINGYRNKTPGMKDDYNRASRVYHENKTIFDKIMRGEA